MDHIDLDLPDADGDILYIRVRADGRISWDWQVEDRAKDIELYRAADWEASYYRCGLQPFIEAAFAELGVKVDA